ncbi:hypothetical protein GGI25_002186 [Coemansia spiralis]|uniref:Uncharacterized protein n=2 Tax=Coemansia TaxID=4863 RepID=A0A9W8GB35_9FUNG|nr:hypothetical protein GGI26_000132 [Coemansia sp. RSA 1358]KAJ2678598.1 hypothetical protein GGI25_002186 [Coemansia spiralis]
MHLFGKRKSKLEAAINNATVDVRAYERLYDAFSKHPEAPSEAFQYVVHSIVSKQPQKEPRLRDRILSTNKGSSNSSSRGSKSHVSRSGSVNKISKAHRGNIGSDPEVYKSLAYLTVLHGIVWSYPREMAPLLKEQDTSALLVKFISSTFIPITVRETMLCMVSNWCILFKEDIGARLNMEGVVDTIKEKTGLSPLWQLLPIPPVSYEQAGWPYPPPNNANTASNPNTSHYNCSQLPAGPQAQGSISLVTLPHSTDNHQQQQPYHPGAFENASMDPVFLSQQRELMKSLNSNPHNDSNTAFGNESVEVAPEFIAHMLSSSSELTSMCDILTETLIALNVEEDPSENAIVTDMVDEVKERKSSLANFISMLGPNHVDIISKLTETSDRVDRCQWLFDKTQNSHNEWKAIQESLKTSAAEGLHRIVIEDESGGSSSSAAIYSPIPLPYNAGGRQAESSQATARLMAVAVSESSLTSSSTATGFSSNSTGTINADAAATATTASALAAVPSSSGESTNHRQANTPFNCEHVTNQHQDAASSSNNAQPENVQEMSSKARGKMADPTGAGDDDSNWGYYDNNSNSYGGYRSGGSTFDNSYHR